MVLSSTGSSLNCGVPPRSLRSQVRDGYPFSTPAKRSGDNEKLQPALLCDASCSSCFQPACHPLSPMLPRRRNRNPAAAGGDAFIINIFNLHSSLPTMIHMPDMTSGQSVNVCSDFDAEFCSCRCEDGEQKLASIEPPWLEQWLVCGPCVRRNALFVTH